MVNDKFEFEFFESKIFINNFFGRLCVLYKNKTLEYYITTSSNTFPKVSLPYERCIEDHATNSFRNNQTKIFL